MPQRYHFTRHFIVCIHRKRLFIRKKQNISSENHLRLIIDNYALYGLQKSSHTLRKHVGENIAAKYYLKACQNRESNCCSTPQNWTTSSKMSLLSCLLHLNISLSYCQYLLSSQYRLLVKFTFCSLK